MDNLVAVEPVVHRYINSIWAEYAKRSGGRVTAVEVEAVERLVKKHFERWYSQPQKGASSKEAVLQATQGALDDLSSLLARSGK